MTANSTLHTLFQLFPNLQARIQEAQVCLPEAVLQTRGEIQEDCTAVLLHKTTLTGLEAEALRISRGLPETYREPLIVSIEHQPTLVFSQAGSTICIELTTSLAEHRKYLTQCNSIPVRILHFLPGDEDAKQAWHKRFENQRIHGSWFQSTSRLVKAIQELAPTEN